NLGVRLPFEGLRPQFQRGALPYPCCAISIQHRKQFNREMSRVQRLNVIPIGILRWPCWVWSELAPPEEESDLPQSEPTR
ncbi:hypothetical protein MK280_13510, partial [Myxococcota bacterium]|nr:hypothetical protein [Myxococcota bacterium]